MSGETEIKLLMETALESLREMIDVNTIIGEMVETKGGAAIIPVSRVSCGYVAGGGEYGRQSAEGLPFAGGSGAGVCLKPIGFLVVNGQDIRLISADCHHPLDKMMDFLPLFFENVQKLLEQWQKDKQQENSNANTNTQQMNSVFSS